MTFQDSVYLYEEINLSFNFISCDMSLGKLDSGEWFEYSASGLNAYIKRHLNFSTHMNVFYIYKVIRANLYWVCYLVNAILSENYMASLLVERKKCITKVVEIIREDLAKHTVTTSQQLVARINLGQLTTFLCIEPWRNNVTAINEIRL